MASTTTHSSRTTTRLMPAARALTSYRPFWAKRFGTAPFLPTSRAEMEQLGWDSCDIIIVTGDAYVDHPSFGMAVIGRVLEAQGFRVGIIAQPDWHSAEPFRVLGRPNLFWGVTAGNMDSMINHYTADRKIRRDDAYTPGNVAGHRPDRAAIVYSQRCREAYKDVPIILGGIEGSLRRIAHYDYWSDKVRRSIVADSKCDLLLYGNAERALVEIAHRLARREPVGHITDVRGTAFVRRTPAQGWLELDSTEVDRPGRVDSHINPYQTPAEQAAEQGQRCEDGQGVYINNQCIASDNTDIPHDTFAESSQIASTSDPSASASRLHPQQIPAEQAAEQERRCSDGQGVYPSIRSTDKTDSTLPRAVSVSSIQTASVCCEVGVTHVDERCTDTAPLAHQQPSHNAANNGTNNRAESATHRADQVRSQPLATPVEQPIAFHRPLRPERDNTVIRLPSYEQVRSDPVLYAHANRVLHLETNPGNARALVQRHGTGSTARDIWINPPPIPLTTVEMDWVFGLPYARSPHPRYADAQGRHDGATKIPAWEMIRFSVNIMRGCFGGCTFCSITEHEGRIIQSRSEESVVQEVQDMRDRVQGFTGIVSDLGGPTANMYRLGCRSPQIEAACRKPSCVYPGICQNLRTNHNPLIRMYRRVRALPGIKKVLIGSGLRYDLAVHSPEYVKELVQHHVGGYLKIAPEHTEAGPLSKMMKPGIGTYDRFKQMFEQYSAEAGKQQYLIPYFIAAHPGTTDEDMLQLALWLKANGFRADQVQAFYPSPMATATAMYHTGMNTLKGIHRDSRSERVDTVKGERRRRLHKAFLRWHDPNNWPLLREALQRMGRADLIGNGKHHLIPRWQPATDGSYQSARRSNSTPSRSSRLPSGENKPIGRGTIDINYPSTQRSQTAARARKSSRSGTGHALASTRTPTAATSAAHIAPSTRPTGKPAKPAKLTKGRILTRHTGLPPR